MADWCHLNFCKLNCSGLKSGLFLVLMLLGTWLSDPTPAIAAQGLQTYINAAKGYEFAYPKGWVQVPVQSGPDVAFHDLIETTENISVVINPVSGSKTLEDLGSPGEVGYRLSKAAIAPPDSGRIAELVDAEARTMGAQTYYILEYAVTLPNQQHRHNLASAVIDHGQLYTFNISAREQRWPKMKTIFADVVRSFKVN